ncbi:MAG: hypothetical protein V2B19_05850 [Pseudomonadota bacterium]
MKSSFVTVLLLLAFASVGFADEFLSASGRLKLWGSVPLDSDRESDLPSLMGRVKLDTPSLAWHLHAEIEGGWDGSVALESRSHAIVKTYDAVYQRNTPYLEFKEFYGAYVTDSFELRAGVQRFAWGRLDEYPINDHLNPWDYTQFLLTPLEERKIGVPSLSALLGNNDWRFQAVLVPLFVPCRLSLPGESWSGFPEASALSKIPDLEITPAEPDLPPAGLKNSSAGFRLLHYGPVEWALTLFHGYDSRPVFKTTALAIHSLPAKLLIDPGSVPDFHKMTSMGIDAAGIIGDWSLRAEAAYSLGRYFNTGRERWGYPSTFFLGKYSLNSNEHESDTLEYGIGVDYRLFEDSLLILQAQQTIIVNRPNTLYERQIETIAWATVKTGWLNQRMETNLTVACNPEHRGVFTKVNALYGITDYWKAGISAGLFAGDSQSLFGRFSKKDQLGAEIVFFW